MSVLGIFTDVGIAKAQEAANNEGFSILPTNFGVSRTQDALDPSRTTANAGQWYQTTISSFVAVSPTTIKVICTIPPGAIAPNTTDTINEIYLYGVDTNSASFLMAIGHPSTPVLYDPSGSVTFELQLSLTNADLTSQFIFQFTQATEVNEHNLDVNAHPAIQSALNKAGIYVLPGPTTFAYSGQNFDEMAEFAGTKATGTYGGKTFTAAHNGTQGNSITLTFDGSKTVNQVIAVWNNANPRNTVTTNAVGTEVLSAGSLTLSTGTYLVSDRQPVYRDVDGLYKRALDDGTIKSKVAGFADLPNRIVRSSGFFSYNNAFAIGTDLWLSTSVAGAVTTSAARIKLGVVMETGANGFIEIASFGGSGGGSSSYYDAIVSDSGAFQSYATTQEAITAVPSGSSILIDKLEVISTLLDTQNKAIKFVFADPTKGWTKHLGTIESQLISFSAVPNSGTWRIEWNGNETTDLAYNASASTVQTAFLLLPGVPVGTTITGNYTSGFTITYSTLANFPLPTFASLGTDEVQHLAFDAVPDNGTFQLDFNGQQTVNIPWNATALDLEGYLEALSNITDVSCTGNFSSGFDVTFINADGKKNQPQMTVVANSLELSASPVNVTVTTTTPGKLPASNIKNGVTPVVITPSTLVDGHAVGPTTCIQVTANKTQFVGKGLIRNFTNGIDLNGFVASGIDMIFDSVTNPVVHAGLYNGVDYTRNESYGFDNPKIITVGTPGDYPDLDSAYTAASAGDKILVLRDQLISSAKTYSKNIQIEFLNGARMVASGVIAGTAITLANEVKTKNLRLVIAVAGSYTNAFLFQGSKGHHENLILESSGGSVLIGTGFNVDSGAESLFIDGAVLFGASTISSILTNNSGFRNHNVVIRDKENSILHTLAEETPPLKIYASSPLDSKLNIAPSIIQLADGSSNTMPPLNDNIFSFPQSTIDFQTGSQTGGTTGGTFDLTRPIVSSGDYVIMGLTYMNDGSITASFSAPSASLGGLGNPGGTFVPGGMPIGYVYLQSTGSFNFKTADSTSNVIENKVGTDSRIFRFGGGAGGGGSGLNVDDILVNENGDVLSNEDGNVLLKG